MTLLSHAKFRTRGSTKIVTCSNVSMCAKIPKKLRVPAKCPVLHTKKIRGDTLALADKRNSPYLSCRTIARRSS